MDIQTACRRMVKLFDSKSCKYRLHKHVYKTINIVVVYVIVYNMCILFEFLVFWLRQTKLGGLSLWPHKAGIHVEVEPIGQKLPLDFYYIHVSVSPVSFSEKICLLGFLQVGKINC